MIMMITNGTTQTQLSVVGDEIEAGLEVVRNFVVSLVLESGGLDAVVLVLEVGDCEELEAGGLEEGFCDDRLTRLFHEVVYPI